MIKIAYPAFVNVVQKDGAGNILSAPTVELWHRRLNANRITSDEAIISLDKHIDSSRFEPTIADIVGGKPKLNNYDIQKLEQEQEQLLLEEYHQKNEVIPPPDHVYEMIESVMAKMKAGVPKDE